MIVLDGQRVAHFGSIQVGNATDYTNVDFNGWLQLYGGARVNRQQWIQAESIRAPLSNPATFVDIGISGAWQFANGLTQVIICKFPLPTDVDATENITIYVGWSSPATSKICRWQVEYLLREADEDMSAPADATLTQDEGSSSTTKGLIVSSFTISKAHISSADVCLLLRVSRLGGADTLAAAANIHGMCFHYASDRLGEEI